MATPIRIKRSAVPGKRPQVSDLQVGELALNTYDAELVTVRDRFAATGIATEVVPLGAGATVSNVLYVTKDGNDNNTGKKLGDAKATIAGAVAISTTGDVIRISAGTYTENNPISLPKQVSLVGDSLREVTVVPENAGSDLFYVAPGNYLSEMSFTGTMNSGSAICAFNPDKIYYTGQSAYISNCTNFITNSIGMKVDGSKTIGPFKSMVTDSFTQYNSNGIGVSITNEGYAQIVSMFTINNDTAVVCNSGGQCDITNSNSSFGNYGLVADGVGYQRYVGVVTSSQSANKDEFALIFQEPVSTITNATYDGVTGLTTITTNTSHGLEVGMGVSLSNLGFTCSYGDYTHQWVSSTGNAVYSGGDYPHTFVSAATSCISITGGGTTTPNNAEYTAATGDLKLIFDTPHGLVNNTFITIVDDGLTFTCSRDNNQSEHSYPRNSDPISGIATAITVGTSTDFTINVGASPIVNISASNAIYNPITGDMVLAVGSGYQLHKEVLISISTATYTPSTGIVSFTPTSPHGLSDGEYIKFDEGSLKFTCAKNDYDTTHDYPRISDPTYNKWLPVKVFGNSLAVNVGVSQAGDYEHKFVSSTPNNVKVARSTIGLSTNGFTFKCSKDNYATEHQYPRITDPAHNSVIGIGTTTDSSFTVNVGTSTHDVFPSGVNGYIFDVVGVPNPSTFTAYVGPNRHPHTYVSGGSVKVDIIRPFDGQVVYIDSLYQEVQKITLTNEGSGYTTVPTVTIDAPPEDWGIRATAVATVKNGKVVEIDLISTGRGYTFTPNITISGGGGSSAAASLTMLPTYYSISKSTPISSGISTITLNDNVPYAVGVGSTVPFYKQSRIIASSHSFEYVGTGVDPVNSLPSRGAVPIQDNEIDDRNGGLTIFTSTDQSGQFRIGDGVIIDQQTGTITGTFYSKSLFSTMTPFILALGGD